MERQEPAEGAALWMGVIGRPAGLGLHDSGVLQEPASMSDWLRLSVGQTCACSDCLAMYQAEVSILVECYNTCHVNLICACTQVCHGSFVRGRVDYQALLVKSAGRCIQHAGSQDAG